MSKSYAPARRAGDNAEAAVVDVVDELDPVPDTEVEYADAVVSELIYGDGIRRVALPVVEVGTLVEIKSAVYSLESGSSGRFYLRRGQHERLKDSRGAYLFAVTVPRPTRPVLGLKIAPATCVDDVIPSWIDVEDRSTYAQVAWTKLFDDGEVRGRDDGPIEAPITGDRR